MMGTGEGGAEGIERLPRFSARFLVRLVDVIIPAWTCRERGCRLCINGQPARDVPALV